MFYNKKYGMRTSGVLWLFWCFLSICGIVQYRSLIRKADDVSHNVNFYLRKFIETIQFYRDYFDFSGGFRV